MNRKLVIAFLFSGILAALSIFFLEPWLALVAIAGPVLAWVVSALGLSGAVIFTWLSGGGNIPIIAMIGFIVFSALGAYSYFN